MVGLPSKFRMPLVHEVEKCESCPVVAARLEAA